jgi:hypothetical protein
MGDGTSAWTVRRPAAAARALFSTGMLPGGVTVADSVIEAPLFVVGRTATVDTPPATVAGTLVVLVVLVVTVWLDDGVVVGEGTGVVATLPPLQAANAAISSMPPSRTLSWGLGTRNGRPPRQEAPLDSGR